jgi:hypothetical protein
MVVPSRQGQEQKMALNDADDVTYDVTLIFSKRVGALLAHFDRSHHFFGVSNPTT